MREFSFKERLAYSQGVAEGDHPNAIRAKLSGCVKVEKANVELDKKGIDYIATMPGGMTFNIDLKARAQGCSKYWTRCPLWEFPDPEPELALETFSVMEENGNRGKVGWTLDDTKWTNYTFHVFHPSDSIRVFLLDFPLLRMAFAREKDRWMQTYRVGRQFSDNGRSRWRSECVFVPVEIVRQAMMRAMEPMAAEMPATTTDIALAGTKEPEKFVQRSLPFVL